MYVHTQVIRVEHTRNRCHFCLHEPCFRFVKSSMMALSSNTIAHSNGLRRCVHNTMRVRACLSQEHVYLECLPYPRQPYQEDRARSPATCDTFRLCLSRQQGAATRHPAGSLVCSQPQATKEEHALGIGVSPSLSFWNCFDLLLNMSTMRIK